MAYCFGRIATTKIFANDVIGNYTLNTELTVHRNTNLIYGRNALTKWQLWSLSRRIFCVADNLILNCRSPPNLFEVSKFKSILGGFFIMQKFNLKVTRKNGNERTVTVYLDDTSGRPKTFGNLSIRGI